MINKLGKEIQKYRMEKGFLTPTLNTFVSLQAISDADLMLGKLMLVVSEVGEAAEAVRHGDRENFIEELADICIRIFDIASTNEIDLEKAIREKMDLNKDRPVRHGKKTAL